jgi:hypothetical protein
MACTGQESTQAPQSVQVPASIVNWSSPWLIASTGQVGSHAPQEMHSLEITWAMIGLLGLSMYCMTYYTKGREYNSKNLDCRHNVTA